MLQSLARAFVKGECWDVEVGTRVEAETGGTFFENDFCRRSDAAFGDALGGTSGSADAVRHLCQLCQLCHPPPPLLAATMRAHQIPTAAREAYCQFGVLCTITCTCLALLAGNFLVWPHSEFLRFLNPCLKDMHASSSALVHAGSIWNAHMQSVYAALLPKVVSHDRKLFNKLWRWL